MAPAIEHIVVLMLENRSFDSMLGWLYPGRPDFDGRTGKEFNLWHRRDGGTQTIPVWNDRGLSRAEVRGPAPDPGETFADFESQFWGAARMGLNGHGSGPPDMSGFVDNYMQQPLGFDGAEPHPAAIMHCLSPEQVPVLSLLARAFGVSDRWFASAPCQTWPNRFFMHTGTAGGWVNNEPQHWPYRMPSLFRRMSERKRSWAVYFHDIPNTATLYDIRDKLPTHHFRLFHKDFEDDAQEGRLPEYCFIEPRYFVSRFRDKVPNEQHPPTFVVHGEELIARAYNALRQGPGWERTLFVIVYDEHGGLFDHVPPPAATPPGGPYPDGFAFDRFGARVPAVIVSAHIPAGSILRPVSGSNGSAAPFDHTSVIKTVQDVFDLGPPLTARVAAAPSLVPLLGKDGAINAGPPRIDYVRVPSPQWEIARLRKMDNRSGLQLSMIGLVSMALGTTARVAAHLRHGIKTSARRAGIRRRAVTL